MNHTTSLTRTLSAPVFLDPADTANDRPQTAVEVARRRLQQKDEILTHDLSSQRSVVVLDNGGQLAQTVQKSQSCAARFFKWMASSSMVVVPTTFVLQTTRLLLTWQLSWQNSRRQSDVAINDLSGSIHLAQAIHALAPVIAHWLQPKLINSDWPDAVRPSLMAFFKGEHATLTKLIDALLSKMYINIATNIRDANSANGGANKPVRLIEVISCIYEIVNKHLSHINTHIEAIENNPNLLKRQKMLNQLIYPLIDDFLVTALPEGEKELPVTHVPWLSRSVWTKVQKRLLPGLFLELYSQLAGPLNSNHKEALANLAGGESLASLAEALAQNAGEILPTLLSGGDSKDEATTPLTSFVTDKLSLFFAGSAAKKQWLGNWLKEQLVSLGNSANPEIKKLWLFLGGYLEPILAHVLYHMSELPAPPNQTQGRVPDVMGIMAIKLFSLCSRFFNTHRKAIDDSIAILKASHSDPLSDVQVLSLFNPLREDLLKMMGLDQTAYWPLPDFLKEIAAAHLKAALPKFLIKQYIAITESQLDDKATRTKLRALLFDDKNLDDPVVTTKVVSSLHEKGISCSANMFEEFYQSLWKVSGTENIVITLEGICAVFSSEIVSGVMTHLGVSKQEALIPEANPFMRQTVSYLKKWVESVLLGMLGHIIETTENKRPETDDEHAKQLFIMHLYLRLGNIFGRRLKNVDEKLKELKSQAKGDARFYTQELRKIFAPLAEELHAMVGSNPFKHLPLDGLPSADKLKDVLWTAVRENILPDVIAATYAETMAWKNQLPVLQEKLEHCYRTTHAKWASHVVAKYAADFIRNHLSTASGEVSESLVSAGREFFAFAEDKTAKAVTVALEANKSSITNMIAQNVRQSAESEDAQIVALWPALNQYLEGAIAKVFVQISTKIQTVETENPDLIIDMAIAMLKDTAEYFKIVNSITEELGEAHGYRVPTAVALAAFGERLHDGVPFNPDASEEEKQRVRLEGCFIPLAAKILKLADLTVDNFPMPSSMKGAVGELMMEKIIPLALLQANMKLLEPNVRDAMMLQFVQTLYAALNGMDAKPKEGLAEEAKKLTDKQKHLNETCGALVLELVKLIPDNMVQYVFMKEKVKSMSAAAIGEAMMPHLSRNTLLQIIDGALFSGLPSFHRSKWEGKVGREVLVPLKTALCPDGKKELKVAKYFKFHFPKNAAQQQADNDDKKIQADHTHKMLRDEFVRTISSQLSVKAWEFVKAMWHSLQAQLNDFIERQFPETGPKVKAYLDKIFHWIFFDALGAIISFMITPLIKVLQFVVERIYIYQKADDIIKNIHSETLEHLLYKWTDVIIDSLLRPQQPKQANP